MEETEPGSSGLGRLALLDEEDGDGMEGLDGVLGKEIGTLKRRSSEGLPTAAAATDDSGSKRAAGSRRLLSEATELNSLTTSDGVGTRLVADGWRDNSGQRTAVQRLQRTAEEREEERSVALKCRVVLWKISSLWISFFWVELGHRPP